jgi:hypothetical protein
MAFPLLSTATEVPAEYTAFTGRFAPAGLMVLLEIVLSSFPVNIPPEKNTIPEAIPEGEPPMAQFVIVLLLASLLNLMVEAVAKVLALLMVRELPPELIPSKIT